MIDLELFQFSLSLGGTRFKRFSFLGKFERLKSSLPPAIYESFDISPFGKPSGFLLSSSRPPVKCRESALLVQPYGLLLSFESAFLVQPYGLLLSSNVANRPSSSRRPLCPPSSGLIRKSVGYVDS